MSILLENLTTNNQSNAGFPTTGLPIGLPSSSTAQTPISQLMVSTANSGLSTTSSVAAVFPRVNSFSCVKLNNNTSIVALASQPSNLTSLPPTNDPVEILRRETSVVYLLSAQIDNQYASPIRRATIVSVLPPGNIPSTPTSSSSTATCIPCGVESSFVIQVDTDIVGDINILYVLPVDGPFVGLQLNIINRVAPNLWQVQFAVPQSIMPQPGECFQYVAYGNANYSNPVSLASLSPLPQITVNGVILSATNPQVAANTDSAPGSDTYVYVIAEALVNGASQLFFYGIKLAQQYTSSDTYGWQQLTFDGDNKNAQAKMDRNGNLHITWESSRCQLGQVYYGVMGPASRFINNASFVSVVDKQAQLDPTIIEGDYVSNIDPLGNISWLNNSISLPAGTYRLSYRSGANWTGSTWSASVNVLTKNNITVSTLVTFTSQNSINLATCENNNIGATYTFNHNGGPLGLQFSDTIYVGNYAANVPLVYDLKIIALNNQPNGLAFSLLKVSAPTGLDLRELDAYGNHYGPFWTAFTANGGTTSITNNQSFSVSGNPSSQKFSVFGCLNRDQNNLYFNTAFSQLSYQITFDLSVNGFSTFWQQSDINEEFILFKQQFTPTSGSGSQENQYVQAGKKYSIHSPEVIFESIIPIVGSYEAPGLCFSSGYTNQTQIKLHHFMLAMMPQKVRFIAKSTQGLPDIVEEYFTGYYKLALVLQTSANQSDRSQPAQQSHWIRQFGGLYKFSDTHDYKILVHYAHNRNEYEMFAASELTDANNIQQLRYAGDIIVLVDNQAVVGDSFDADFSDQYPQFDIGFGCATVGEFRSLLISPYDASLNENVNVTLNYNNTTVGPHSVVANDYLTMFAMTDRNVSTIFVDSLANSTYSLPTAQEAFLTTENYLVSLGMQTQKFSLTQMPITLVGKNGSPSIDIDRCGRPHIAFQSLRTSSSGITDGWDIYYTGGFDIALPFRFETQLSNSSGNSFHPTISVDYNGRRLVAWHDNRDGFYQIYAARSPVQYSCEYDICNRNLAEGYGPSGNIYYDPYDPYIFSDARFGGYCAINFTFENTETVQKNFHFIVNFYYDSYLTSFAAEADSRMDISNWAVNGSQMPYNGFTISPGGTATVTYIPSLENGLNGLYYAEIVADDGTVLLPLDKVLVFACGTQQPARCSIPALFTNHSPLSVNSDFRITVYRDQALTQSVLSVSTRNDVRKWISAQSAFPVGGVSVSPGTTIAVAYNPEILPNDLYATRNQSNPHSLVCGVVYWIKVESIIGSTYTTIDTFAFECPCPSVQSSVWRTPRQYNDWICSGNGGFDIRISKTNSNALFPYASASFDGFTYIAWEDQRFTTSDLTPNSSIYYGIWDANYDKFYSSGQGYADQQLAANTYFKPRVLVNNSLHPTFIYTDGISVYSNLVSLYKTSASSSSSLPFSLQSSLPLSQPIYNTNQLGASQSDVETCSLVQVVDSDVVELLHQDSHTPIALVDSCLVHFEIKPFISGAYAVRIMNEVDTNWSDWISILPQIQRVSSSSSSQQEFETIINAYYVANNRFIVPWVLSRGNGTKTVSFQVLTPNGISATFTTNVIAVYSQLKYSINFYRDANLTIPAGTFNGTPVIGTSPITVTVNDLTTLIPYQSSSSSCNNVFFSVEFDDNNQLDQLLALNTSQQETLTADIFTPTYNILNVPLLGRGISLPFGASSSSSYLNGYYGSFQIGVDDGINYKDGLGFVRVNVPTPCNVLQSSSTGYCAPIQTAEQILGQMATQLQANQVSLEQFKIRYSPEIMCSFISNACTDVVPPPITQPVDDQNPPPIGGTVNCQVYNWISPKLGEVGFYKNGFGQNETNWAIVSQIFQMDFSNPNTDYVQFNTSQTQLDDVLLMIPATANVTYNQTSTSSISVAFQLPQNTILFGATSGAYCQAGDACTTGSVQKSFTIGGVPIGTIPAGTPANNGTGEYSSTFNYLPNALGINYNPSSSSSAMDTTGGLKTTFSVSVSKAELQARGYITNNGVLNFKLVHIISGTGFAYIYGMTCGASCFLSSSSSSH